MDKPRLRIKTQAGELRLDPRLLGVTIGKRTMRLPRQPFNLLALLVANADDPVSRAAIVGALWPGRDVAPHIVDVNVLRLRRRVGEGVIENVHGLGFRICR